MRAFAVAGAALGGVIWIVTVVITAMRSEAAYGGYRSTLDLHPLMLVAFVFMAAAATRLASEMCPSGLASSGAATAWIGVALFSVNVAFILATGDDAPVWPTHYAGFFLLALGIALVGVAALRRGTTSPALAVPMIAAPVMMPLGNAQDDRVLLWLPLGLASLAMGLVLVSRRRARRAAN